MNSYTVFVSATRLGDMFVSAYLKWKCAVYALRFFPPVNVYPLKLCAKSVCETL